MIQDIAPQRLINAYQPEGITGNDMAVLFRDGAAAVKTGTDGQIQLPSAAAAGTREGVYLFSIDETRFFLVDDETPAPDGFSLVPMRELRRRRAENQAVLFALYTAYHLWRWYRDAAFCGRCGHRTVHDEKERAMRCPVCGNMIYPRINPAVIVGVVRGDCLLLTRYRTGFAYNALVAGFTEIGETAEETVRREVMEEVGLTVRDIRYYKSQPWGIAQDLLMGFFCRANEETIRMDSGELKEARWVKRCEIELQPTPYSLTNEMMKIFRDGEDPFSQSADVQR